MTRRSFLAAAAASPLAAAQRTTMGLTPDSFAIRRPPRTALEYLELAHSVGAGGVQADLASLDPAYLKKVRALTEKLGAYFEVLERLPRDGEEAKFEATVKAAKEAGAIAMRSVCLIGRRYETFNTLEEWRAFVADSRMRLTRAARIVEKHRLPLGIENHKDFTAEEMAPLMKEYSSEYMGVCIDFGNNISLCDDPMDLVESLAPFVINTHIKDNGVEECEDGFLLSEVPLGAGFLDLKRIVNVVRARRPQTRFSLDMLTRNPLRIPCFTEKYWLTFPERNGRYLARMMATVRARKSPKPLPRVEGLDREAQLRMEDENLKQCLAYARNELGLV